MAESSILLLLWYARRNEIYSPRAKIHNSRYFRKEMLFIIKIDSAYVQYNWAAAMKSVFPQAEVNMPDV